MYNKCTQYRTDTSSKYNGPTTDDGDTEFCGDEEPQNHLQLTCLDVRKLPLTDET